MTLQEYNNQDIPKRMPEVILERGEYTIVNHESKGFRSVYVNGYPSEYCLKPGNNRLYVSDEFGNPKAPSCFWLKK